MPSTKRSREARLRRVAKRHGLRLEKSRSRSPEAPDFGAYFVVDGPPRERGNWRARALLCSEHGISLDEVEVYLATV